MAAKPRPAKARLNHQPLRDDTGRLSDRVAAEIEQLILRGELAPGSQLPTEGELGELFEVSRTVVRDAVRTLAARGLLDVRAGRGTTILPPSDESLGRALFALLVRSELTMGDVMEARAAIETQLVPLAATQSTPDQRRAVTAAFERLEAAVAAGDFDEAQRADQRFHLALLRATNLPALEVILRPMQHVTMVCSVPADSQSEDAWQVERHRAVAQALAARDPEALREAMRAHFAYMGDPEYADVRARPFGRAPVVEALLASGFRPPRGGGAV